jgi:hypothetical protein
MDEAIESPNQTFPDFFDGERFSVLTFSNQKSFFLSVSSRISPVITLILIGQYRDCRAQAISQNQQLVE